MNIGSHQPRATHSDVHGCGLQDIHDPITRLCMAVPSYLRPGSVINTHFTIAVRCDHEVLKLQKSCALKSPDPFWDPFAQSCHWMLGLDRAQGLERLQLEAGDALLPADPKPAIEDTQAVHGPRGVRERLAVALEAAIWTGPQPHSAFVGAGDQHRAMHRQTRHRAPVALQLLVLHRLLAKCSDGTAPQPAEEPGRGGLKVDPRNLYLYKLE